MPGSEDDVFPFRTAVAPLWPDHAQLGSWPKVPLWEVEGLVWIIVDPED
jgi:hypothetical protein